LYLLIYYPLNMFGIWKSLNISLKENWPT
jgi:hypothetical protein